MMSRLASRKVVRLSLWRCVRLLLGAALLVLGLSACLTGGVVILMDDFASPGRYPWQTEGDAVGRSQIVDGRLVLAIDQPETLQFVTLQQPGVKDFILEVDGVLLAGSPRSSYGVLFRLQPDMAFYRFEITGDGVYGIEKRTADGQWLSLTDGWRPSPLIKTGLQATNRLKLFVAGSSLEVYVNDQFLQRLSPFDAGNGAYGAGQIALDAGTFAQGGLQVAFDNVILREP